MACPGPPLEFSCQVWALKYNYLIDKIESVQGCFTKRIRDLEKLSYSERLNILGLETQPAPVWLFINEI